MLVRTVLVLGLGNDTDRDALLALKDGITYDPDQVMSSWNDSSHFCKWAGVTCSLRRQRVVALNLESLKLVGTISPTLGNLSFLRTVNLSSNNFKGKVTLSRLQHLDLSSNSLGGEIPLNLSRCTNLISVSVAYNSLIGSILFQLTSLNKLVRLSLTTNNLTGIIPPWIGNFSSLECIILAQNSLHGIIPNEVGQLTQLQFFQVASNMLSGVIPPLLYNITSLYVFGVAENQLQGSIPLDIGLTLPNLQYFTVSLNSLQGGIPLSLSNASMLQLLDFASNSFTGSVPNNLGSLTNLNILNLAFNKIGYGREDDLNFITSLYNCTNLEILNLSGNRLGGVLPDSIGNLSTGLQFLLIAETLIRGPLPTSIENLINLTWLAMFDNLLNGTIPFGIGKLRKLNRLSLRINKLSGEIPSSLGNLTQLISLYMGDNRLEGTIPPSLGNSEKLLALYFSSNKLSGIIPKQIFSLSSLVSFVAANNSLSGSLPQEVGASTNLEWLVVSENDLSGEIPVTLGRCLKLERLQIGGNLFHGPIPQSLRALRGLKLIDFSHNNLTGKFPDFLMNVSSLEQLDLSYNDFDGEVPKEGIFMNASAISVRGNKRLCGGIKELHLPICIEEEVERSRHLSRRIIIAICLGVLSFILVTISCSAYWLQTSRKSDRSGADATTSSALEKWKHGASYLEIFNSTNGFSEECFIGRGSIGSVYKGVLSDLKTCVAIKVFNLQQKGASRSFMSECEALKNIRHRNLIGVITVCSSIDFEGNDFKALIFEFMTNGNLEQWLHSAKTIDRQQSRVLTFVQRQNIAIDIAFGLEYLHHRHGETIVHCDIKPSNILLDTDMTAHVGDFGLARIFFKSADDQPETQTLSSGLKGSIGYIPPEYGTGGKISTLGDMYSYGILLLEMFTGKRPTDEMFKDGLNLYDFVSMAFPSRFLEIVDASLLSETQEEFGHGNESEEAPALSRRTMERERGEFLVSVLAIALSCCALLPKDRGIVSDVVNKMIAVRDLYTRVASNNWDTKVRSSVLSGS